MYREAGNKLWIGTAPHRFVLIILFGGLLAVSVLVLGLEREPSMDPPASRPATFSSANSSRDCGAASLYLICQRAQRPQSLDDLLQITETGILGTSMFNLRRAAEELGWQTEAYQNSFRSLQRRVTEDDAYAILHVNGNHFVAVLGGNAADDLYIVDPPLGVQCLDEAGFEEAYDWEGAMLLLRGGKK